jgi:hypothetical protein
MLSVTGVFDDKNLILKDDIIISTPQAVIVTFLDDDVITPANPFAFLNDPREDIYSDDDLKIKY